MKTILSFAVILSVIVTACGLQCFVCNSHRDSSCSDEFHDQSIAIKTAYLMTCNESNEGLQPFCRKSKTWIEREGVYRVHRDCGYLERVGYDCYQKRSDDYVSEICQCSTDYCNSATTFGAAAAALIIPFTVAALL